MSVSSQLSSIWLYSGDFCSMCVYFHRLVLYFWTIVCISLISVNPPLCFPSTFTSVLTKKRPLDGSSNEVLQPVHSSVWMTQTAPIWPHEGLWLGWYELQGWQHVGGAAPSAVACEVWQVVSSSLSVQVPSDPSSGRFKVSCYPWRPVVSPPGAVVGLLLFSLLLRAAFSLRSHADPHFCKILCHSLHKYCLSAILPGVLS